MVSFNARNAMNQSALIIKPAALMDINDCKFTNSLAIHLLQDLLLNIT